MVVETSVGVVKAQPDIIGGQDFFAPSLTTQTKQKNIKAKKQFDQNENIFRPNIFQSDNSPNTNNMFPNHDQTNLFRNNLSTPLDSIASSNDDNY